MVKVVISHPGERIVSEFDALIARATVPSTAPQPPLGLVEISQRQATELIPGPVGPQGVRGSRWTTGSGAPGTISGQTTGDMYLDNSNDHVWQFDGSAWNDTGTDISGSPDTGAQILAKLIPVDGAGSGLDADLLDGQHGAYYLSFTNATGAINPSQHGNQPGGTLHPTVTTSANGFMDWPDKIKLDAIEQNATADMTAAEILTAIKTVDGTGSGLDADLLDGLNSSYFASVAYVDAKPAGAVISDTPPATPSQGQTWWESDTGGFFISYNDGNSTQWVQINGQSSGNVVGPVSAVDNTLARFDLATGKVIQGSGAVLSDINDLSGINTLNVVGIITGGASFVGAGAAANLATTGAGTIKLMPNGVGSAVGQATLDSAGTFTTSGTMSVGGNISVAGTVNVTAGAVISSQGMTAGGTITSTQNFLTSTTTWLAAPSAAGTMYFRPNGSGSSVGQTQINSAGFITAEGNASIGTGYPSGLAQINCGVSYSSSGANCGWSVIASTTQANIRSSANITATGSHALFYNPNGLVGSIGTNASATAYNTSSDERLKTFTGPLSGDDAIAIIRADPVRRFTWNVDGSAAVGWGAQTSYEISHDLASPPPEFVPEEGGPPEEPRVGEPGFQPWGMDQGKRTPYLWAALAAALDEIDALKARVAALEGAR